MSTLIIRNLNDQLASQLKTESKKRGLSVNRYLHHIVERALRPALPAEAVGATQVEDATARLPRRNTLGRLAGTWTQADYEEFNRNTQHFSEIDAKVWQ